MAIKIIKEKTSKKKKVIRKPTKRKTSTNVKRDINLSISYRNGLNVLSRKTKKKSNKKIVRKIIMLLFVICLAFSTVYAYNHLMTYLCSLERFFVEDIEITGCQNITESEIKKLIPFEAGEKSLIELKLGQLEKKLKKQKAELKDINISRTWDKKVVVSVTERLPEVFIDVDDKKVGIDFDNIPFNLRGNMAYMKIPTLVFNSDDERKKLLIFYKQIKNYILSFLPQITEIKYGDVDDIILVINNKTNVYWGLPKENKNEKKSEMLGQVLNDLYAKNKDVKSIDLSLIDDNKNKVVVDIFNEEKSI